MKNVSQKKANARAKAAKGEDVGMASVTLFECVRAEAQRARELMAEDPAKAADALDVLEDLLRSVETTLGNVISLARGAEERLGPAALAFARMDRLATDAMLGGDLSDSRSAFSLGIGDALEHLSCIPRELAGIAETDEPLNAAAEE